VAQQRFPEQVDRVLQQLQRLVRRTRPLLQAGGQAAVAGGQAAVAFTSQQTPRVSRLFGHVRGHGMRLLQGGRHNVQRVRSPWTRSLALRRWLVGGQYERRERGAHHVCRRSV